MSQEKTEQPTPKKLRDARKRGEVAKSRDLGTAAVILAASAALAGTSQHMLESLTDGITIALRASGGPTPSSPIAVLEACSALGLSAIAPMLLIVMVAGGLASFLQIGGVASADPVTPKLSRLDVVKGTKNLFSQRQLIELVKSVVKIVVIGWVAFATLRDGLRGTVGLVARDTQATLSVSGTLVMSMLLRVGAAIAVLAVLDVMYQRWRFRQDQKMTKEEVKREHKESEGDPHAKQQRERLHREIVEHAALEEVRGADVLVVNPTHLAVALTYDEEDSDAPEVVAKGQDDLAQRMIRAAEEAGVPVMRDVPLAQALHELSVGEEIPEQLYEAVAAVLRAAWSERDAESE
jgi:type III secretion YscU/HrpY family protein